MSGKTGKGSLAQRANALFKSVMSKGGVKLRGYTYREIAAARRLLDKERDTFARRMTKLGNPGVDELSKRDLNKRRRILTAYDRLSSARYQTRYGKAMEKEFIKQYGPNWREKIDLSKPISG